MDAKLLPAVLMSALSFGCIVIVLFGLRLALRRTGFTIAHQKKIWRTTVIVITAWLAITGVLACKGFFTNFSALPPRPVLLLILPLVVFLFIAFSKAGSTLLTVIPPHWLIGMQAFRILVEILLWKAFLVNLLPIQMTFEGNNFDGLSGLLAIPVAMVLYKKWIPQLALVFNMIGVLLLINILVIAVLSMPTPLRHFMNEPPSTLVGEFPFIYLPGVLVAIAQGLHIFSLRQWWLLRKSK
ncbi:MAG: hypothetical protein V4450_05040 [Bacteroidota bacterium]